MTMSFTFKRNGYAILPVLCLFLAAIAPALAQDVRVETQQQARTRAQGSFELGESAGRRFRIPSWETSIWFRARPGRRCLRFLRRKR